MSKRSEFNIGETAKTSVKVHHGPGGASNWSLGWGDPSTANEAKKMGSTGMKYHNESNIVLGETTKEEQEAELRRQAEEKKRKQDELNSKLPSYDPRTGGKSTVFFGDEKTDYRKKDEVYTSVKVKAPPGGKSSIQFG